MRPSRRALVLFAVVFTFAAIYLLYEGISTGDYVLVALVIVAYMFVLMIEARLSLGPSGPVAEPAKKPRAAIRGDA